MRTIRISIGALVLLAALPAVAQDASNGRGDNPRQAVGRQFETAAPRVGEPLPDLAGLDEQGREFRLTSLKGQYSVLVFGCLT